MLVVLAGQDRFLRSHIAQLVEGLGLRLIQTHKFDRIFNEMKRPGRLAIVDVNWEEVQKPGALKQLVNIGRISGNKIVCICPNQDEDLKKLARQARADAWFIRYELLTAFKEYLSETRVVERQS